MIGMDAAILVYYDMYTFHYSTLHVLLLYMQTVPPQGGESHDEPL